MMSDLKQEIITYKSQLKQWMQTLGLPQYQPPNSEIEVIISLTLEKLRQRSSVQLAEDTIVLTKYSFFLQQKANECQTFLKWSKQIVGRLAGDDRPKLVQWTREAELRLERIQYLARRIELIGQSINNLIRARYNERK